MSTNIVNKGAFLREQRLFPQESQPLSVEIDRSYVEIANKMNDRTIGFFTTTKAALTGEKWSFAGITYAGYRQSYQFSAYGNIPHGLTITSLAAFVRMWGCAVSNTGLWFPIPYVDSTAANNQVQLTIDSTNIILTAGAGSPPTLGSGFVVLEWISQA